jgi:hypothetical protein
LPQRSQRASLVLDGYTADEMGLQNAAANVDPASPRTQALLKKSRFTRVLPQPGGAVKEEPESLRMLQRNQANPANNPSLTVKQTNIPAGSDEFGVWLYVSQAATAYAKTIGTGPWGVPIKVSILYGVGFEMNRHGLRSAFEKHPDPAALILVPGIEPDPGGPRYGVAIRDVEVRDMLQRVFGRPVSFEVRVMGAFSTGINGLNQTLLNNLVDQTRLERIVIYDCLYKFSSGSTATALQTARKRAGLQLKLLAYKCTTGGNTLEPDNRLTVVVQNPGLISSDGVIDLFYNPAYAALITFRSIEGGLADGSLTLTTGSPLEVAYNAMKSIVMPRGKVVSSKRAFRHVFGTATLPAGAVYFEDWAADKANAKTIASYFRQIGRKTQAGSIRHAIWSNQLPGWPGGDGEENHDLLLPDFSWEFLPP